MNLRNFILNYVNVIYGIALLFSESSRRLLKLSPECMT